MKYIQILVVVLFFFLFGACGMFKKQHKTSQNQTLVEQDTVKEGILLTADSINKELYDYSTLQAIFNGTYVDQTTQLPLKGVVRINKGKFIWISIRPAMAIEASRILLTKDSIRILDRLNNYYYADNYGYIKDKFKLSANYEMIESIFTGRLFFYPTAQSYNNYFKSNECDTCTEFRIQKKESEGDMLSEHIMRFETETLLLKENMLYIPNTGQKISLFYGSYIEYEGRKYYSDIEIKGKNKNEDFNLRCQLEEFIFNTPLSAPFKVPQNYTQNKAR